MSGPWEKYQDGEPAEGTPGPWDKYGEAAEPPRAPAEEPLQSEQQLAQVDSDSYLGRFLRVAEPAATIATNLASKAVSGVKGLASVPVEAFQENLEYFGGPENRAVEDIANRMDVDFTYQPKTTAGAEGMESLQAGVREAEGLVTDPLANIVEGTAGVAEMAGADSSGGAAAEEIRERGLEGVGGVITDATGSPAAGVAATLVPELMGGRGAATATRSIPAGRTSYSGRLADAGRRAMPKRGPEAPENKPITSDDLRASAGALYEAAERQGVNINPQSFDAFADTINRWGFNQSLSKKRHGQTISVIEDIVNSKGNAVTLRHLETLRQDLALIARGEKGGSATPDAVAAQKLVREFDKRMESLTPDDIMPGSASPEEVVQLLRDARGTWRDMKKLEPIEDAIEKAEMAASFNYNASGHEHALRQQFQQLVRRGQRSPSFKRQYTPMEWDAIVKVAQGTPFANKLRWLGKFAPKGYIETMASAGLVSINPAGVLVPAIGIAGRAGATRATQSAADDALGVVTQGARNRQRGTTDE